MKNSSGSSIAKLLAATIIGVVFIFLIGTAVSGWQKKTNGDNSGEIGDSTDNADEPNGDTDENSGTADNNCQDTIVEPEAPKPPQFTNYLTGLETMPEFTGRHPYVITAEPNAPLYGISGSEITIEVPTESGETRFLIYRTEMSQLGKIGAIAKTRNYISQIVKFFGGILVANGNEDIVTYSHLPSTLHIDLSKNTEYTYRENGKNIYTDYQNLSTIAKNQGIDTSTYVTQQLPFDFCDFFEEVNGKTVANCITLLYSSNETKLRLNNDGTYLLSKNGRDKVDMLDGKTVSYKNVFILFADMITYEMSSGIETVVNTASRGTGYYISNGTLTEIRWNVEADGQLIFKNLSGEKLIINRGNSYIGYYKASESNSVVFD